MLVGSEGNEAIWRQKVVNFKSFIDIPFLSYPILKGKQEQILLPDVKLSSLIDKISYRYV